MCRPFGIEKDTMMSTTSLTEMQTLMLEFVNLMIAHGDDSKEATDFLESHRSNVVLYRLAYLAQRVRRAAAPTGNRPKNLRELELNTSP